MKDKIFGVLQRVGRSFMLPIALLPVAGLLLGIGSSFTNETMLAAYGLNSVIHPGTLIYTILDVMSQTGSAVFNNLALLFAMGVAIGMARKEKEVAALSGAVAYIIMNTAIQAMINAAGGVEAMPANSTTTMLGITTLQMGVFGGIVVGLGVAALHNKFYKIELPQVLAFFGGTRFVPIVSSIVYLVVGIAMFYIWPVVQSGIAALGALVLASGYAGTFIYGLLERALIPFGLHHVFYMPFWQTAVGGTAIIDGVTVTGANTATAGDTVTLTATVAPANATDKSVTWSTSDAAVATVNANGVVTTKKAGKVTITATSNGDQTKFGSIEITVSAATVPVTSVTVAGDAAMTVDGEQILTATVAPADATDKTVTWKSSDATVATVDANGKVVAKKAGEVTITATAGGVSGTLKITVSDKAPTVIPVQSVTVTGKQELVEDASTTLTATVAPADATDKTVTWKSSDESVATVDKDGVVTAKKAGTVTITATAGGVSGTLHITVTAKPVETVPVTSVEVTVEAGATVSVGKTRQATATIKPGNATNKKVTWKSSDESIATVDANGVITAKKAGKVVITATSTDGTDKSGSVEITVADETKPTPDHKSVKADTGDVTAGKTGTVTEPKDVAGWKSRSIIKQGKLGKAEIADGTLVYAAGDKTGDDSFVVQYTMADGTVIDVTYSVTVKAAETGKNDGDGKGDGVAKTGAAVGTLAGLGLMLLAVGVSVVMIRRKRSA